MQIAWVLLSYQKLRPYLDFFFFLSLITPHSIFFTHHLKYPNFPNPTHLALITQFCITLFQNKNKKVQHCSWTVGLLQKWHWKQSYENWKHLKCVFNFHNSSLKNQRIEWWKQKPETKSKRTSQPWVPSFLSNELWKQQI